MVIAYVAINEIEKAINFMKYFEKDYEGCGGCYFLIAKILIYLKRNEDISNINNNRVLNSLFAGVNKSNKHVWGIMESENYIADAMDDYYGVFMGGKAHANNIVEIKVAN